MSTKITQMDNFSIRLKQERRRLGMNQTEFASAGGVQKQAQFTYEKGLRYPDASYLAGIAEVGVDVLYLLTGRPSDPSTLALDPDEERLLAGYRELKPREKKGVQGMVAAMIGAPDGEEDSGAAEAG
ncbi:helix-turn-helix domain-containing protein [Paraburkholderia silvatlantica]|uniref:helix-turn-helix domain-containing protein n=1 Tax=Paraburkholderia silvatlantica TaxID=321895 RepID=UPI0010D4F36B|nr:helix-turn-helix transcriptional regulator [Paraburkholderia silvatlantica]TDQ92405.1 Xre family transcriptional regulator [Paraburkholderia silvatlantica]